MPPGKMAAQAGHAFTDSLYNSLKLFPDLFHSYTSDLPGTKVVLEASTLERILLICELAKISNIPYALIEDSNHVLLPHFTGKPIITAIGLGPITKTQAKPLTKSLNPVK